MKRPATDVAVRAAAGRLTFTRRLVVALIRLWQYTLSAVLPPSCRFSPSCSAYAIEAVSRYGVVRGGWMAARRIMRCHPWGGSGHDPVP